MNTGLFCLSLDMTFLASKLKNNNQNYGIFEHIILTYYIGLRSTTIEHKPFDIYIPPISHVHGPQILPNIKFSVNNT